QGQAARAERRHQSLEALFAGQLEQEFREVQIVFDDEEHAIARLNDIAIVAGLVDEDLLFENELFGRAGRNARAVGFTGGLAGGRAGGCRAERLQPCAAPWPAHTSAASTA